METYHIDTRHRCIRDLCELDEYVHRLKTYPGNDHDFITMHQGKYSCQFWERGYCNFGFDGATEEEFIENFLMHLFFRHCRSCYKGHYLCMDLPGNKERDGKICCTDVLTGHQCHGSTPAEAEAKKFYDTVARQRAQIQARIKDLDNIIRCLYEDRVCGRITPERYDTMASGYEQEQAELKQELESITARISEMDLREQYVREFMEDAKAYIEMPKLTPELLRVFIRCIEVYEKEEKYSRTRGNTILVHFTFEMPKQKTVAATMAATAVTADRNVA